MKIYLAPLEGTTTLIYRNAFIRYFDGVDKLYIPFISPSSYRDLTPKEKRELSPLNNKITFSRLVPQIISKNAQDSLFLIHKAKELGYQEVNLNLGCPSLTVVSKQKGSGLLKDLSLLDQYLSTIFLNAPDIHISIKTRIGFDDIKEWQPILNIFNRYPVYELIIHPRLGKEKYLGKPHLEILTHLNKMTNIPLVYNGDIQTIKDIEFIQNNYPYFKAIMIGRGLISRPYFTSNLDETKIRNNIKNFFLEIWENSIQEFGWGNAKFFLKQTWFYLQNSFVIPKKISKKVFKEEKLNSLKEMILKIIEDDPMNWDNELSASFLPNEDK